MKRESIHKIHRYATARGLWVMKTGSGEKFRYEFFNRITGKLVLTYYPSSQHWLSTKDRDGRAPDVLSALEVVFGP